MMMLYIIHAANFEISRVMYILASANLNFSGAPDAEESSRKGPVKFGRNLVVAEVLFNIVHLRPTCISKWN